MRNPTHWGIGIVIHVLVELRTDGPIYELGCAWGSLAIPLAKAFPDQQIIAYELSPLPYWVCRLRGRNYANLRVVRKDYHDAQLQDAAAVTAYLMRKPMPRLYKKMKAELERSTPVVCVAFLFPGQSYSKKVRGHGLIQADVALYML